MGARHGEADDPESYALIGAGMEVHSELGPGFAEPVYQEAFAIELELRTIPFRREHELGVRYKDRLLQCKYRPDFIGFDRIIVELKALPRLTNAETSQTLNYLKAAGYRVGLVLNFGGPSLEIKRLIL